MEMEILKKRPIWEVLVDLSFFDDRKTAESWIMAGKVLVNENRIDTPGQMVSPTGEIRIKGYNQKYVSKGGLKLEGALSDFKICADGVVAIDAGASTGGFTDCLIQHGASKVYAVDVGYGQLAGKLRIDPRVVNMEKVNIGDIVSGSLPQKPSLATVDLSYLSLKKAIPIFADILNNDGELICLVKPLFEVQDSNIRRTGNIEDINVYKELLIDLFDHTNSIGHKISGVTYSHVTGNKGTREFFLRIALGQQNNDYTYAQYLIDVDKAIENVMNIDLYKKL
jgi:23S rRNA (cytidine1920-2'-O)/16S rRNA (cytidine1409-2'-O)-methyltransferase